MLEKQDVIIVSFEPWGTAHQSECSRIAYELGQHNRVLYVNPPLDNRRAKLFAHLPDVAKRLHVVKGLTDEITQVADRIWTLSPGIIVRSLRDVKNPFLFDVLNYYNNKKLAKEIAKAVAKLGFSTLVLLNYGELFRSFYLNRFLPHTLSAYFFGSSQGVYASKKWHGLRLEPLLLAKSDVVLAGSIPLLQAAKQLNKNSFFVGQGFDEYRFSDGASHEVPAFMGQIPKPIVGYIGSLRADRIDFHLIKALAEREPGWSFVLIGPEDEVFATSELHRLPNVFFPGNIDEAFLPACLSAFDVAIDPMPHHVAWKLHYPRKVDEYLIMGKPVVAVRSPASEFFEKYIALAESADEFHDKIGALLEGELTVECERGINFAKEHTWAQVSQNISKVLYDAMYAKLTRAR